ncbi:hypothetical protein GW17_00060543, partial [Ensete ventricosum]
FQVASMTRDVDVASGISGIWHDSGCLHRFRDLKWLVWLRMSVPLLGSREVGTTQSVRATFGIFSGWYDSRADVARGADMARRSRRGLGDVASP